MLDVARWLNIFLFPGITWLAGYFFYQATRSFLFSALSAALLAVSPVLVPVYSWAMSEPLFLFCLLLTLFFLWRYLSDGHGVSLILAGAAAGYAFLTRYNGVVFLVVGVIALLFFQRTELRKRLLNVVAFLLIGAAPMLFWFIYDYISSGRIASRIPGTGQTLQAMLVDFWNSFSFSLLQWVMPDSWAMGDKFPTIVYQLLPPIMCIIFIIWLGILTGRLLKKKSDDQEHRTLLFFGLLSLLGGVYLVSIFVLRLVVYPVIAINNRMLSPSYVSIVLLGVLMCYYTSRFWLSKGGQRWVLPVMLILAVSWYGIISCRVASQISKNGLGFMTQRWQQSELIAAVRQLPADTILVTNEPKAVLILAERTSYTLKEIYFREALETFSRYGDGDISADEPQRLFRESGAALVLFDSIQDQLYGLYGVQLDERISVLTGELSLHFQGSDGAIYYYPGQP